MNFAAGRIPSGGKSPRKCIYSVPAQETANIVQSLVGLYERRRCSNSTKMRNLLKFAGVPQTNKLIRAVSGLKSTILRGHVEKVLLFNKFFLIVDTCLSCEDTARQSCAMVRRWRIFGYFLRPVFSVSHVQHISDLHSKLALRPHHVWKYGRHPICDA